MRSHLSPLDATFLEIEEADEAAHVQIGWVMVFDPIPGGGRPSLEKLREQVRSRLEDVSVLRRRLSMPSVEQLSLPVWLPDPALDVGRLIRQATLPGPGDEPQLLDWLGDYLSHPLDRTRPLWETTLLDGLKGNRWALAFKVHHCLIDGVSGMNLVASLLDAQPQPEEGTTTLAQLVSAVGGNSRRAVLTRPRGVVGEALSGGIDAAIHPHDVTSILAESRSLASRLAREEPAGAPETSLNGPIGTGRKLAAVQVPLADLKRMKQELGGTLNDVVLTATAGGLRHLFESRGEQVDHMRAVVPIGLDQATETIALGNPVSSLLVDLSITEADPLRRHRKISTAASEMKESTSGVGEIAAELAGLTPPLVQSTMARLAFTSGLFNLTVANGPTSPLTLYSLGSPLRRISPFMPIFSGQALSVAAVGYDGNVFIGVNADRDSVPDVELVRIGIEETLHDLSHVAA